MGSVPQANKNNSINLKDITPKYHVGDILYKVDINYSSYSEEDMISINRYLIHNIRVANIGDCVTITYIMDKYQTGSQHSKPLSVTEDEILNSNHYFNFSENECYSVSKNTFFMDNINNVIQILENIEDLNQYIKKYIELDEKQKEGLKSLDITKEFFKGKLSETDKSSELFKQTKDMLLYFPTGVQELMEENNNVKNEDKDEE